MKHKLLRVLVAVVLVCCLVVSWSPIQVKANTLAMAGSAILKFFEAGAAAAGMSVFSYVAIGLGITFGAAMLVDAVGEYIDYTGELGVKIYYYPDGTWTYGVDMGFVESVRAFLFDTGVISTVENHLTTDSVERLVAYIGKFENAFNCNPYCYWYSVNGTVVYFILAQSPVYLSNGKYAPNDGSIMWTLIFNGNILTKQDGIILNFTDPGVPLNLFRGTAYQLSSIYDVEFGDVASLDIPTAEAYAEWYGNARPYATPDTEEEVAVLPIPYNPNADPDAAPGVMTQPDIWQGSIADPIPGIESGTDTTISVTPWETFKTWISTGWQSIIQAIPTAGTIADAIGNVIKSIFIPDADFISEKWNAIRSRFDFADSITATGEVLVNILDGLDPEPPLIYIDLGAAEGSYNIGGEVPFIDLRWYAQYKPTMDMIVSAFLWLAFVWRLILKLPGIISGMPGEFVLMNLPVNLPHLGIGSGQRREELESGRNNRRLGDGH